MIRRMFLPTVLLALTGSHYLLGQRIIPTQELVFPHFAVGGGWETSLTIIAQGADDSAGAVFFLDTEGNPLSVSINGEEPAAFTTYSILYRAAQTFNLTRSGQAATGYIVVSQALGEIDDNDSFYNGSINGVLTFRYKNGDTLLAQVGVPASRELAKMHLPYDHTEGNQTGFSGASIQGGSLEFVRYDESGSHQDSKVISMAKGQQRSFMLTDEFPDSRNQKGFFTIKSDTVFYSLALNVNGGLLSTTGLMPSVFERDMVETLAYDGEKTTYTVRLIQDGLFLTGVAERQDSGEFDPMTGFFFELSGKRYLQLTRYRTSFPLFGGEPSALTYVYISEEVNRLALRATGVVALLHGAQSTIEGHVTDSGTFTMYARSSAQ